MSQPAEKDDDLLSSLLDADILVPRDDDEFVLSDSFNSLRAQRRHSFEDSDRFTDVVRDYTKGTPLQPDDISVDVLSLVDALDATVDTDRHPAELFHAALVLRSVDVEHPTNGVPDGFISIRGEEIAMFLALNPAAVVYCWREDCPSCETVVSDFNALLSEGALPSELGLAAVYGPDCPELLSERYGVSAAPTTLFCANGEVDSRYIGAKTPEAFLSEIELVIDQSSL